MMDIRRTVELYESQRGELFVLVHGREYGRCLYFGDRVFCVNSYPVAQVQGKFLTDAEVLLTEGLAGWFHDVQESFFTQNLADATALVATSENIHGALCVASAKLAGEGIVIELLTSSGDGEYLAGTAAWMYLGDGVMKQASKGTAPQVWPLNVALPLPVRA